ncbi:MAG: hypothetical protein D3918_11595, partial [Candidatus Electrothrix sp. AX2]|nr:hypothetical protein [Candidatus Electrothrix gigas]
LKKQAQVKIFQLQKEQNQIMTEAESLRAQVIGFEKVVEERNTALSAMGSELQACKVNTKVLLGKISEQENTHQGMEQTIRLMVQDLSQEAEDASRMQQVQQQEMPTE